MLSGIVEVLIVKLVPTMQIVSQFRNFEFSTLKRRRTRELRISRKSPAVTPKVFVDTKVEYQGTKQHYPKLFLIFSQGLIILRFARECVDENKLHSSQLI